MDPFLGEIRMFAFGQAPHGWAACNGQVLAISQNQALFALLGTMYGGDGQTTFRLPDLRERGPVHQAMSYPQGRTGGAATHTLTSAEMPVHNHLAAARATADQVSPAGATWAGTPVAGYAGSPDSAMHPASLDQAGAGQPHDNLPPHLALQYCIATAGIFPSRA